MERKDEIAEMLSAFEDPTVTLTSWELGFLESVTDQFETSGTLSDRQYEKLASIYKAKIQ